jgi:hypothetical protein
MSHSLTLKLVAEVLLQNFSKFPLHHSYIFTYLFTGISGLHTPEDSTLFYFSFLSVVHSPPNLSHTHTHTRQYILTLLKLLRALKVQISVQLPSTTFDIVT